MTMTTTRPDATAPAGTGRVEPGTGTGTGTEITVPPAEFRFGTRVKIDPGARDISGSALAHDERTGTVHGVTEHPHSGQRFYRIGTDAGTDVVIPVCLVTEFRDTVLATIAVEVYAAYGWNQVSTLAGLPVPRSVRLPRTQQAFDAYVIRWASKLRRQHQSIRVTAVTPDGQLAAYHEEPGSLMAEDPRNPRHELVIELVNGEVRTATFGSRQARRVGAIALADDPSVTRVDSAPTNEL